MKIFLDTTNIILGIVPSDCCGSGVEGLTNKYKMTFLPHQTVGPSFYLKHHNDTDVSPPNRISDLTLTNVDTGPDNNIVSLRWSAPGGDWNTGQGTMSSNVISPYISMRDNDLLSFCFSIRV